MSVDVIFRGQPPEQIKYQATCGHCDSVLTYLKRDTTAHDDPRPGESSRSIQCAVCGKAVYVPYTGGQVYVEPKPWRDR